VTGHVADDELRRLRWEYVRQMEAHPPSVWPSGLFLAVNAVLALQFGDRGVGDDRFAGKARLSVVRDTVRP